MREDLDINAPAEANLRDAQGIPPDPEGIESLGQASPVWQWLALGLLVFCLITYVVWLLEISSLPDVVRKVVR